ncbi:MAG: flagellar export protein FliJ [Planctomycetota bacterium]
MPRFQFQLSTLLKLREAARDQRRTELAEAYHVDELLQSRQRQLQDDMNSLRDNCRLAARPGTVRVDPLIESQRYELMLKAQEHQLGQQREAVAAEIERRREALVEANREVRILEKLRERQSERHAHAEARREARLLDEVAQRRALPEEVEAWPES